MKDHFEKDKTYSYNEIKDIVTCAQAHWANQIIEGAKKANKKLSTKEELDIVMKSAIMMADLDTILFQEDKNEKKENPICCICGNKCENAWGNNPYPVKEEGRCCDNCNTTKVIPARLEKLVKEKEEK